VEGRSQTRLVLPSALILLTWLVGLGRFELPTSRLSGVRSNQLSYRPSQCVLIGNDLAGHINRRRIDCQRAGTGRADSLKTEQDRRTKTIVTAIPIDLGCIHRNLVLIRGGGAP
jgi:hypothetical protein